MDIDLNPYFKKYESVVAQVEAVFSKMKAQFPQAVRCGMGCSDCCYALFDITLVEALYINRQFHRRFSGVKKEWLLEKANKADRAIYKIKKKAYQSSMHGRDEREVIEEISGMRIRCPLLGDNDLCDLYDYRPIACRIYGIPQAVDGKGRSCGFSGFKPGEHYPTFNHDMVHDMLMMISMDLVKGIGSNHNQMADVLVPVSMALITDYNAAYLGLTNDREEDKKDWTEEGGNDGKS